jgi:hypothetical protein
VLLAFSFISSFTPFLLAFYILITWAACAAVLIGLGSLLLRSLVGNHRPLEAFWAGLFLAVLLLQLAHFFVPITWHVEVLLGALSLIGLLLHGRSYVACPPSSASTSGSVAARDSLRVEGKLDRPALLWSFLLTYAIALRCVGPCEHYDTGFYGAMAVRWFNTYPLVPGLANLMAQLGFNSSVFLCIGALNHGLWNGLAFHLFSGLLLSALVFSVVPAFCRLWLGETVTPGGAFLSILVIPVLFWATNSEIVGTNTDLPTTFVTLMAFSYLLDIYSRAKPLELSGKCEENSTAAPLLPALLLFPLALAFKISGALFAFLGWLLACGALWRLPLRGQVRRRLLLAGVLLPAALLLTWSLRGILTSGYAFFPSGILGVPVDWRVPQEWVNFQAQNVRSWARIAWAPMSETEGWQWLRTWLSAVVRNRVDFIFPALFSFAGIVALLRRPELRVARWLWALVPAIGGLIFWFWKAPAIRFGEPMIWGTAGTLGAAAVLAMLPTCGVKARRAILLGFVAMGIWCSYPRTIWRAFYRPAFEQRSLPKLPQVPVAPYKADANLTVLVPFKKNQCWDAPLPCSPYFFDSLRLRRGTDLRSGFSVSQASGSVDKSGAFHKLYWAGPEPEPDH